MVNGLPPTFQQTHYSSDDIFAFLRTASPVQSSCEILFPEEVWVQQELQFYEDSYTEQQDLRTCIVTFNVASKKPPQNLASLIALTMPGAGGEPVDLIMVSLQEVDMSASAMLKDETDASVVWVSALQAVIGADSQAAGESPYFAFPPKQLVGLLLCVFIRRSLLPHAQKMAITTVATGALGTMGNKGAVGLHLGLCRSNLCFINMHLAAGQKNVVKRNNDVSKIFMGMDFNTTKRPISLETRGGNSAQSELQFQYPEFLPHNNDVIVVAGDLNYRVNLTYRESLQLAMKKDYATLLKHDEFVKELANTHSPWMGFVELTPTYPPTYRYDIGTNNYDTSEKQRVPSYTDRIAIWTRRRDHQSSIRLERLQALTDVMSSDHKPVQACLCLPISREVLEKKISVTQSLRDSVKREGLDRIRKAKISVNSQSLNFGVRQFGDCGSRQPLKITNEGDCVAVIKAFRQQDGDPSKGAWLRVFPLIIFIPPRKEKEVMIECQLDRNSTEWVRNWRPFEGRGEVEITSTLVLCVRNGDIHFVECRCTVRPSVFGNTLDNISLLRNEVCAAAYTLWGTPERRSGGCMPQIPKELWYLCEAIYERGAQQPNLFTENPSTEVCDAIMKHLNTQCTPLPSEYNVQCISACLIYFLQSLQEPVVPYDLYEKALAVLKSKSGNPFQFIQQQLPPLHANVWIYVCSLMNFLLRPVNTCGNGLTTKFLARVLSDVMLVRPEALTQMPPSVGTCTHQEVASNAPPKGGTALQAFRQQLQQEREDALRFVECFLVPPPAVIL